MRERIDPPVCVALDTDDLGEARRLVDALWGIVPVFKVGLQLFASQGPEVVEEIVGRGSRVFLDLKINDIPKTVAGAVGAAAKLGAEFLTVHSNAGRASVRAAIDTAGDRGPKILVVSVLTSLDDEELLETGVARTVSSQVDAMAALAADEGAHGIVLGAPEVARVRAEHPGLFLLVPGIRTESGSADDQKRFGTAAAVVAAGADLIVLGRAVTATSDPVRTASEIVDGIRQTPAHA